MERTDIATTPSILDGVPLALAQIKLHHLMALRLQSMTPKNIGLTPAHDLRIGFVTGGRFESRHEGLNGQVLEGGNDWQTVRTDNTTTLSVRLVLETDDGEPIAMT